MSQRIMTFGTAVVVSVAVAVAQSASAPQTPATQPPPAAAQTPPAPCGPNLADTKNVAKDSRCFELRTYTLNDPAQLDLLHERFRKHSTTLLQKHGMTLIGFWHPTNKPGTLVYLVAYKDRAARDAAWREFNADPEWVKVRTEMNVPLKVDSVFMSATDYSAMK
jgi:hypothetical protein